MALRAGIFAASLAAWFLPFVNIDVLGSRGIYEMGPIRLAFVLLPCLALAALATSLFPDLSRHTDNLDVLTGVVAFVFSMILVAMLMLTVVMMTMGLLFVLPFLWGAYVMAGNETPDRALVVAPGSGGWLLLAATAMSIVQMVRVWRNPDRAGRGKS